MITHPILSDAVYRNN